MAILSIVAHHARPEWLDWIPGYYALIRPVQEILWVGVDLFFILSGWLIGGLYFKEEAEFGGVEIGRFWKRRWMRTLPPYYAALLCALALHLVLSRWAPMFSRWERFKLVELVFLQNYIGSWDYFLTVGWSLCIEEHFYLALPLLLLLQRRHQRRMVVIAAVIAAVCLIRTGLFLYYDVYRHSPMSWNFYYTTTHLRIENLLIGVWLALVSVHVPRLWARIQARARVVGLAGYAAVLLVLAWFGATRQSSIGHPFIVTVGFTLLGVAFGAILVEAASERSMLRVIPQRVVEPIALCSYSLYLTHHIVGVSLGQVFYAAIRDRPGAGIVTLAVYLVVAAGCGWFFYALVERTSIQVRDRWVPRRRREAVQQRIRA